jgi:ribosomal peptide maturation radical SAM protein 1
MNDNAPVGRLRILLLSMPWHALDRPSLGLSLLKAALEKDGHRCEVRYLGFELANTIGLEDYLWVHGELPYTAFAGDWLFTTALYGERPGVDQAYIVDVLQQLWRRPDADIARLLRIRARLEPFLDHCQRTLGCDYDIVGFTSTFEQNIASLALAKRLALRQPRPVIVFGGANWEGEMGEALLRRFSFVDVVVSGEGDETFPALVNAIAADGDPTDIPGLVIRGAAGQTRGTGPPAVVRELDRLPLPRYEDYLTQLDASPGARGVLPTLLLETSRGCWWGAKHHCTFCGLNGGTMQFRSKSAPRVMEEVDALLAHRPGAVAVVDNILDMRYFSTVLPELARRGAPLDLFYEVKANLNRDQVRLLALAGVRHIQPGIESLSDSILKLMRKGTTALQNIQLLKWCAEYGVVPEWNFLYGFPGEDPAEYVKMASLIDDIRHLTPPSGHGPVRLDRFSPYHQDPEAMGMTAVRPARPYQYLYDTDQNELMHIAYYFDYAYADHRELSYVYPALHRILEWQRTGSTGALVIKPAADGSALLLDSRGGSAHGISLEPWQAALLYTMDSIVTDSGVIRQASELGIPADAAWTFLAACERQHLVAHSADRWLGLAIHDPPRWACVNERGPRQLEMVHE